MAACWTLYAPKSDSPYTSERHVETVLRTSLSRLRVSPLLISKPAPAAPPTGMLAPMLRASRRASVPWRVSSKGHEGTHPPHGSTAADGLIATPAALTVIISLRNFDV
jgi:hypothetical protein